VFQFVQGQTQRMMEYLEAYLTVVPRSASPWPKRAMSLATALSCEEAAAAPSLVCGGRVCTAEEDVARQPPNQ
jgi:hypothetical protein